MQLQSNDIGSWGDSLDAFKPEYTAIKCYHPLMCYTLIGRRTVIIADNLAPIEDLKYCVHSPQENRYYFKLFPELNLKLFLFKALNRDWDSYDRVVINLMNYISDGRLYLLLTAEQIADTTAMLERLYRSHFVGKGKVDYRVWIELAEACLRYEHYRINFSFEEGFRTKCRQHEIKIKELWEKR